jgi:hypothetical protein
METRIIARVNNVDILSTSDEQLVPIKPVCEALGVDAKAQRNRIDRDGILCSVGVMMTSTGKDGKQYEMLCLPIEYVFGWLFSIDHERVSGDARDLVLRYKQECYHALYLHFFKQPMKQLEQNKIEIRLLEDIAELNTQQQNIKQSIAEKRKRLEELRDERLRNEPSLF